MLRAIERGLSLRDFEEMTFGMILGYIITVNNDHTKDEEDTVIVASQSNFDKF